MKWRNYIKIPPGKLGNFGNVKFMANHYLLWATGQDHPGFVSAVTKRLYELKCNLEDSSMMRLGSEFAMFVIFSSEKSLDRRAVANLKEGADFDIGLKKISTKLARFTPTRRNAYIVRAHGIDRPGFVYGVTKTLAAHKFNITDLSTHRTQSGKRAGYILLLEGELPAPSQLPGLRKKLAALGKKTGARISVEAVAGAAL